MLEMLYSSFRRRWRWDSLPTASEAHQRPAPWDWSQRARCISSAQSVLLRDWHWWRPHSLVDRACPVLAWATASRERVPVERSSPGSGLGPRID